MHTRIRVSSGHDIGEVLQSDTGVDIQESNVHVLCLTLMNFGYEDLIHQFTGKVGLVQGPLLWNCDHVLQKEMSGDKVRKEKKIR